jgi:hypothetical protein
MKDFNSVASQVYQIWNKLHDAVLTCPRQVSDYLKTETSERLGRFYKQKF